VFTSKRRSYYGWAQKIVKFKVLVVKRFTDYTQNKNPIESNTSAAQKIFNQDCVPEKLMTNVEV